ncbi:MAG: rhamnan synthesis F family protein [Lachnospiraceae bacterium]|jgi:lipopolysaccharide biosynthesis protein|nr:rhamnan synthesis F family protein [Lachnospiraceae bacterium]
MSIHSDTKSRYVIYYIYDHEGIVDDYIIHALHEFQENNSTILVVANGFLTDESMEKLSAVSDGLLTRTTIGGRAGAFREAMYYIGFRELEQYNEVIFTDDSLFGPIFPLSEMLNEMESRKVDFWGLVKHHSFDGDPLGIIGKTPHPEYIDPHFFAMRKTLIEGFCFKHFLFNLQDPENEEQAFDSFVRPATKYFSDHKFKWDVYVDTSEYEGVTVDPFKYETQHLLQDRRCPFVSRGVFCADYTEILNNTCGETGPETYRFIKEKTDYDTKLIWQHLLRTCDLAELHQTMHMDFCLPGEVTEHEFSGNDEGIVFIFGSREKFEEVAYRYAPCIPENVRKVFLDGGESYTAKLLKAGKMAAGYSFSCIIDLFDMTRDGWSHDNWASLLYRDLENTIPSEAFIGNVFDQFGEEPRLGILTPPVVNFGIFFWKVGDGWEGHMEPVRRILDQLDIKADIHAINPHPVVPYGGAFWIRTELLAAIAGLPLEGLVPDDEVMKFLLPYLAQSFGYYTGIVMSNHYAAVETTNEDYKLRLNNAMIFKRFGPDRFQFMLEKIRGTRQ